MGDRFDEVWQALRDPTRRRLLDLVRERPLTTGELCAAVPELSRPNVIKHLKLLERVELVRVEARGRERWNHLNVVPLQEVYERWIRPFEAQWAGRLWRLRAAVEQGRAAGGPAGGREQGVETRMEDGVRIVRIDQRVRIEAGPERVWGVLTDDPGAWWGSPYVVREDRVGLRLELAPGGSLWEDWGDGQGWSWATVQGYRRPHLLELAGTFMMTGAVAGSATFELADERGGTMLTLRQTALGAVTDDVAGQWRAGWADLLGVRLRALAEQPARSAP